MVSRFANLVYEPWGAIELFLSCRVDVKLVAVVEMMMMMMMLMMMMMMKMMLWFCCVERSDKQ